MAAAVGTCLCKRAVDAPSVFVDANIRFLVKLGAKQGNGLGGQGAGKAQGNSGSAGESRASW